MFSVNDLVRCTDVKGCIREVQHLLNSVGAVVERGTNTTKVRFPDDHYERWWANSRLAKAQFAIGQTVLCDGQELKVVGYEPDGLIRLEDDDGELARPEDKLVAKGEPCQKPPSPSPCDIAW